MSEIIKYNNTIDPLKLSVDLMNLQSDLITTEKEIQEIYRKLKSFNPPLEHALSKYRETLKIGNFDTKIKIKYLIERMNIEDVITLISDVEDVDAEKMASIANIVTKSNENMKKIAQLISGISILTSMSYQKIGNAYNIMADLDKELGTNIYATNKSSIQLKEFIYGQFHRMNEEKKAHENLAAKLSLLEKTIASNTEKIINTNNELIQKINFIQKEHKSLSSKLVSLEETMNSNTKRFNNQIFQITENMKNNIHIYSSELKNWKRISQIAILSAVISTILSILTIFF